MKVRFIQPARKKKPRLQLNLVSNFLKGPMPDIPLLFCVLSLLMLGCVMVYSSSAIFAETKYADQFYFLKRHLVWMVIGAFAFLVGANVPTSFWQSKAKVMFVLALASLGLVLAIGPEISGAKRWIRLGGLSFQPSEFAKLTMIIIVSDYLDRRQSRLKDFSKGLLPLLMMVGSLIMLILAEPDLGTPVLMCGVLTFLLFLGGVRVSHFVFLAICSLPVLILAIVKVRYRMARLFAYLNPWDNAQGAGYQLIQSLLALGSGGIFGRGFGESKIKISNLPDCHTDFIFAVLGEELGLIGTAVCVGLFLVLLLRGLKIAREANSFFAQLVAVGISLMIGFQALINMGVASGLLPTKGMPLPLISFGGTSLMMTLFSLGILTRISKEVKTAPAKGSAS